MSDFDQFVGEIRACTLCAKYLSPRPVLQVSPEARILIAGQAPGSKVHQTGIPFDDPSGERLRAWLGVTKAQFYDPSIFAILPMGFCYPGTGKSGDLPPRPECAEAWRRRVLDRLEAVQLTLVIGQYAQAWHLPEATGNLTETVQKWRDFAPGTVVLPHPSPRNNIWLKKNPWFAAEVIPYLQGRVAQLV
jgi:uracil-DNA glycosylase